MCANPDLNLIDGSSIWAQSMTLLFASIKNVSVDFLPKSQPERGELFYPLHNSSNVRILGPQHSKIGRRLRTNSSNVQLGQLAAELDEFENYDIVLARGREVIEQLGKSKKTLSKTWIYLTDIPQSIYDIQTKDRNFVSEIGMGCQRIIAQSDSFKQLWMNLEPRLSPDKFWVRPPVIEDLDNEISKPSERLPIATYAGKFSDDYMTLETLEAWKTLSNDNPNFRLLLLGDKFHSKTRNLESLFLEKVNSMPNVDWIGAKTRNQVFERLKLSRVGLSWRSVAMDSTLEVSTKVLEYASANCAIVINRNNVHESIFGKDYPLFANTKEEFLEKTKLALVDDSMADEAAQTTFQVASEYAKSTAQEELKTLINQAPKVSTKPRIEVSQKPKILVAGHDLKFFTPLQNALEEKYGLQFSVDKWDGHNQHDEKRSEKLLADADVIVCEWSLGNLEWYSKKVGSNQKLYSRFHRQEIETDYLQKLNWNAVDSLVFVSKHIKDQATDKFNLKENICRVIPNYIRADLFVPLERNIESKRVLGMIGAVPSMKRLDLAIDTLSRLLQFDSSFSLRVKGPNPFEYDWLTKRDSESASYKQVYEKINSSKDLRHKVIFDPPGNDVHHWLKNIGYLLSPSDFESFHMAVGEAVLTGAVPVVWNWEGASQIWPEARIVNSPKEASDYILSGPVHVKSERLKSQNLQVLDEWFNLLKADGRREFHP